MVLPGFEHRTGVHCGTAALADALRARGLGITEAMAFGLGAGLGFHYFASRALSPSHLFQGRSAHLERTACEVLGAPVRERREDDPARAWEEVKGALSRGFAPILSTDLAELPYRNSRTRFGGHRVVVAGHDEGRGVAIVADGDYEALQEVPLEALARARASLAPPFGVPGNPWLEVDAPPRPRPLEEAVRDALGRQAREMLRGGNGEVGMAALERFAEELPEWPARARDEADRVWCFRYGWQVIERRGTGGGLFRALYARFLSEAEAALPALARLALSARMGEIAGGWSRLAHGMREIAEVPAGAVPSGIASLLRSLASEERRFHLDLAAQVR